MKKAVANLARRAWRFYERWEWLIFGLFAISAACGGGAGPAAFFAFLAGLKFEQRSRREPVRSELILTLSKEEAQRIKDEILGRSTQESR